LVELNIVLVWPGEIDPVVLKSSDRDMIDHEKSRDY